MKRIETIKKQEDFNNIIKKGKFIKNEFFILYYINNNSDNSKLGIAISNKIGKAYLRNKLKRQTRTLIDKYRKLFKKDTNYIIMIRKSCAEANFETKEKAFKALLEK